MFSLQERPESVVVNVVGALDHSVAEALESVLSAGRANGDKAVVLSFDHCTHVDSVAASVIVRWRKALGARLAVTGARIPTVLVDILAEEEASVDSERLLFCEGCSHGVTFHGIAGCRFARCRCTISHSRVVAQALQSKSSDAEAEETAGPTGARILHRYSSRAARYDQL